MGRQGGQDIYITRVASTNSFLFIFVFVSVFKTLVETCEKSILSFRILRSKNGCDECVQTHIHMYNYMGTYINLHSLHTKILYILLKYFYLNVQF